MLRLVAVLVLVLSACSDMQIATAPSFTGATPGPVPRAFAPVDDSWTRSENNPVLIGNGTTEEGAVREPNIIVEDQWRMWYVGGWDDPSVFYATAPLGSDVTDGDNWTKHGRVYGQGTVESGDVNLATVYRRGDTLYLSAIRQPDMLFATSSDGETWVTASGSITKPATATLWGNRVIWHDGSQSQMLAEAYVSSVWRMYRYTSADGLAWSIANSGNALTSLQVASGGAYGGPMFVSHAGQMMPQPGDGKLHLWYHAAPASGNLPTNIHHATALPSDLDSWTITTPSPVLTHSGSGDEVDQLADPMPVVYGTTAYLFYATGDNDNEATTISVATASVVAR